MNESQQDSSQNVEKVYHLKADEQLNLAFADTKIEINAAADGGCTVSVSQKSKKPSTLKKLIAYKNNFKFQKSMPIILLVCCMVLYLSTRLISLSKYPVYFFTDEAVQTLLAEDLVNNHFLGNDYVFMPTFFYNGYQYNLGTSVYLQVIPYMLFGRVLEVNRGISVLASSFSAIFLYLLARRIFKWKNPWLVVLLLSITPVWFLHSRTAFETSLAFMFYSGFIYFYYAYRNGDRNKLYLAVLMAAFTYYTYSPVRFVVLLNALVFFIIDLRYHFEKPQKISLALLLMLISALPLLRFQIEHPGANIEHLRQLGSYWVQNTSFVSKVGNFLIEYISSFSPLYWFLPNLSILSRHRMGYYPLVPTWFLPFVIAGLVISIKKWKDINYRILILVLLMAPAGGSLVARGVTRILIMVIPFTCLALIGINWLLGWIEKRVKINNAIAPAFLFVLLFGINIHLCYDAINNGAKWDSNYGMGGLQYGTSELAEKIPQYLEQLDDPQNLMLTPTWANGTDIVMRFFFGTPLPFRIGNIDMYITTYNPMPDELILIMTDHEYNNMIESKKFDHIQIIDTIYYPDGQPGFYFVKLQYVDNIEEIFRAEAAERKVLQVGEIEVSGVPALVSYSYLDMGQLSDLFDNNDASITRTFEANPMIVKVQYDYPVNLESCTAHIGGTPSEVDLSLFDKHEQLVGEYHIDAEGQASPRTVDFNITPVDDISEVILSLANAGEGEPSHVHLWEFTCIPQGD